MVFGDGQNRLGKKRGGLYKIINIQGSVSNKYLPFKCYFEKANVFLKIKKGGGEQLILV